MGIGITLECKKCGFRLTALLGIGLSYPTICDKILKEMKEGVYGEKIKEAANTISHAAVHQEASLFVCDYCGNLTVDDVIDLCEPVDNAKKCRGRFRARIDYPDDISYVMSPCIGDTYRVVHSVEHKCAKCNNQLRVVQETKGSLDTLKCPRCREKLNAKESCYWD